MARRSKSSIKPLWIIVAVCLIVGAFIGSQLFIRATGDPYRTTAPLDVKTYLENANSLRGNVYKLEGEITDSLAWSPGSGRLYSVKVKDGSDVVAILIPPDFSHVNIQKQQRFIFLLEVDDKGILRAKNLTKA